MTDLYDAKVQYEIVQRVLDRIRDEGASDSVPNLWDAVVQGLDRVTAGIRQWRLSGHNHADGIYNIGFQRLFHAPPHAQKAVERFHAELERARAGRRSKG
jgi:hypothetical protein